MPGVVPSAQGRSRQGTRTRPGAVGGAALRSATTAPREPGPYLVGQEVPQGPRGAAGEGHGGQVGEGLALGLGDVEDVGDPEPDEPPPGSRCGRGRRSRVR